MSKTSTWLSLLLGTPLALGACADEPVEFGRIHWRRSLEPALEESARNGKPIWLQFQEVPG